MRRWNGMALARVRVGAAVLLMLLVAACGGGGESEDSAQPEPEPTAAAPTEAADEPTASEAASEPEAEETQAEAPAGGDGEAIFVQVGSSASNWPLYIGTEQGFFEDHGLTVEVVSAGSSSGVAQQITAGAGHLGGAGIPDFVRAIEQGADLTIFANGVAQPPYRILAAKDVTGWQDLEGQIVLTGGPADITNYYFDAVAEENGLDTSTLTYLYTGSTANRFAALVSGSVKATLLLPPFTERAVAEGFVDIGSVQEVLPDSSFTAWAVSNSWADANPEQFSSFCSGLVDSLEWLNDPANRDAAIQILSAVTETPPEDSERAYDFYVSELQAFPVGGQLNVDAVDSLLQALTDRGMLEAAGSADEYIDQTCITEAASG